MSVLCLTLSHPLLWRVELSGVKQSKITKWPLLAALGGKVLTVHVFLTNTTQSRMSTSTNAWVKSSFYSKVCVTRNSSKFTHILWVKSSFYWKSCVTVDAFTLLKFLSKIISVKLLKLMCYCGRIILLTFLSCFMRTFFAARAPLALSWPSRLD